MLCLVNCTVLSELYWKESVDNDTDLSKLALIASKDQPLISAKLLGPRLVFISEVFCSKHFFDWRTLSFFKVQKQNLSLKRNRDRHCYNSQ